MFIGRAYLAPILPIVTIGLFAGAQVACAAQANGTSSTRVIQMVNVTAQLEKTIDAKKSKAGDVVNAKITAQATLSNGTDVPVGSALIGHIDSITPSEGKSDSTLVLTFDKLAIKSGKEIPVKAVIVRVGTFASTFGQEDNDNPDANRPAAASLGPIRSGGVIDHPGAGSEGLHSIEGLTLSGSANDATSATLTQAKKNIHLTNNTQLIVSVAPLP